MLPLPPHAATHPLGGLRSKSSLDRALLRFRSLLEEETDRARRRKSAPGRALAFLERASARVKSISQHLDRSDLECAVIGITKAGKSTLINALLGAEALPVSNVPSTAVVIRVRHLPGLTNPKLRDPSVEGAASVRRSLSALCDRVRGMRGAERHAPVVEACYPFAGTPNTATPSTFTLVDTPGVTEATGAELTEATLKCVEEADVALLVLNYANLRTTAERAFLSEFARRRPDFFLRSTGRLVCALTHLDLKDRDGAALSDVGAYLQEHISAALQKSLPSFEQRVWALRAQLGLLGRMAEQGALEDGHLADYMKYLFGRQGAGQRLPPARLRELGRGSLEQSRLLPLERALREQLIDRRTNTRIDAVRSRLINSLNRAAKWAEFSTGKAFAPAVQELLEQVRNGDARQRKDRAS